MDAFGLTPEDYAHENTGVWFSCVDAVSVFSRMTTQFIRGQSGHVIGLNYQSIEMVCRALKLDLDQQLLDDIRVMEFEAINLSRG